MKMSKNSGNDSNNNPNKKLQEGPKEAKGQRKRRRKKLKLIELENETHVAIIGTGPSGLSAALSLQQELMYSSTNFSKLKITLYERDKTFEERKDGYGLTLTYNPTPSSMKAPLAKLGLLEEVARMDCPSRSHWVFRKDGVIMGYYGNAFVDFEMSQRCAMNTHNNSTNVKKKRSECRGFGQRGNLRVPRQVLRRIMMDELVRRDKDLSNASDGSRSESGRTKIEWGKKLISLQYNKTHHNHDVATGFQSQYSSSCERFYNGVDNKPITLTFEDGSSSHADLLVGADGVRSNVIQHLLSASPLTYKTSAESYKEKDCQQKYSSKLSYMNIMIILGITKDFFHPLLDERGFYTLDGTHRLFTMPFEGSRISDLESYSKTSSNETTYTTSSSAIRSNKTINPIRRYMWQLSYKLPSEIEANELCRAGPQILLEEVKKRIGDWHDPIRDMLESTPLDTVWGSPLVDRDPNSFLKHMNAIYKNYSDCDGINIGNDSGAKGCLRTVVLGDAVHCMSPFKGQGCNQALMDGPLLSSWLNKSSVDSAVKGFMREMVTRTHVKVKASREAANFLHSKDVLADVGDFAGIKDKSRVPEFLALLEERGIGAGLGEQLDSRVLEVLKEMFVDNATSGDSATCATIKKNNLENNKLEPQDDVYTKKILDSDDDNYQAEALKLAAAGDSAGIRNLSMTSPSAIRYAVSKSTKETCIHLAAKAGSYHTCRWLLSEADVPIDVLDKWNRSPLHSAVIGGDTRVVTLVVAVSRSVPICWAEDCDGKNPLDLTNLHGKECLRQELANILTI